MTTFLTHNMTKLALHTLRGGPGRPLLLVHGLGERSPASLPANVSEWPGPVYALDLTGHGQSSVPAGGGYTAEVLMGDVDAALAMLGETTVVGRGLGGYIALLIAGGRASLVRGAIIDDGPGLAGGGDRPGPLAVRGVPNREAPPDPFALVELSSDLRPRDYAASFARLARQHSGLEQPITIVARARPDWLTAVLEQDGVTEAPSIAEAIARYAGTAAPPVDALA